MTSINCNPMRMRSFISLLFPISYLLLFHAPAVTADIVFNQITSNCTGGNYTANSKFQTNLNLLFSNLISQSSSSNSNNATAGTDTNRAYGLYLCEGDLAGSDCQSCIQNATNAITQSCPSRRQAIIWSDYCMLRYSDTNFFGFPDTSGFGMYNPNEKISSTLPYEAVSELVQEAPFNHPLMFASNASATEHLYAMAQCTVDLNREGCQTCLTTILADIKSCCTQWKGWRYLTASCWIRYEATPFRPTVMAAPAPQPTAPNDNGGAPQPTATNDNGRAPQPTAPNDNGRAPQPTAPNDNGRAPQPTTPNENGGGEQKSSHTPVSAIAISIVGVILLGAF